jgi:hypothetical protein
MRKIVFLALVVAIFASGAPAAAENLSRKDAKAQSYDLRLPVESSFAPLRLCASNPFQDLTIEVYQVLDLPLDIHEASLIKSDKGYFLKLSLANSTDSRMIGLRYSLVTIDPRNQVKFLVNRIERVSMPAYATKNLTFKTPIRIRTKDQSRLIFMLEQVISHESIWDVVKAKDALDSYAKGDFSVVPTVMRVANQVDAPAGTPRIYKYKR